MRTLETHAFSSWLSCWILPKGLDEKTRAHLSGKRPSLYKKIKSRSRFRCMQSTFVPIEYTQYNQIKNGGTLYIRPQTNRYFVRARYAPSQLPTAASAKTFQLSAGDDFEASCLKVVEPGDTCYLAEGDYYHDGLTETHGTENARITITGDSGACIKGSNTQDRALQIAHDYYTVEGLCFDGQHGDEYVATAIYVLGADEKSTKNGVTSSVTGLQMFDLEIKVGKSSRDVRFGGCYVVYVYILLSCCSLASWVFGTSSAAMNTQ